MCGTHVPTEYKDHIFYWPTKYFIIVVLMHVLLEVLLHISISQWARLERAINVFHTLNSCVWNMDTNVLFLERVGMNFLDLHWRTVWFILIYWAILEI